MTATPQSSKFESVKPALLDRFISTFTGMINEPSDERLEQLRLLYSPNVEFSDPAAAFNGWEQFGKSFSQFGSAEHVGITLLDQAISGRTLFLRWRFEMKSGANFDGIKEHDTGDQMMSLIGITVCRFDADDRVCFHEDSWASVPAPYRGHLR